MEHYIAPDNTSGKSFQLGIDKNRMTAQSLGEEIKELYNNEYLRPFPTDEIGKLSSCDPGNLDVFHGKLEMFFSTIAGYASSADRLARRSRTELITARENLSQSFFEKHSSLANYRDAITRQYTPKLFNELEIAEELRKKLLTLLDSILSRS